MRTRVCCQMHANVLEIRQACRDGVQSLMVRCGRRSLIALQSGSVVRSDVQVKLLSTEKLAGAGHLGDLGWCLDPRNGPSIAALVPVHCSSRHILSFAGSRSHKCCALFPKHVQHQCCHFRATSMPSMVVFIGQLRGPDAQHSVNASKPAWVRPDWALAHPRSEHHPMC